LDLLLSLFPDETEKWPSRFQRDKKPKKPIVLLPNDHVPSSLFFYCQKNPFSVSGVGYSGERAEIIARENNYQSAG